MEDAEQNTEVSNDQDPTDEQLEPPEGQGLEDDVDPDTEDDHQADSES